MQERILRRPEVEARTGLGRSLIYKAIQENRFPRPVKLTKRAVGWTEESIQKWILSRQSEQNKEA